MLQQRQLYSLFPSVLNHTVYYDLCSHIGVYAANLERARSAFYRTRNACNIFAHDLYKRNACCASAMVTVHNYQVHVSSKCVACECGGGGSTELETRLQRRRLCEVVSLFPMSRSQKCSVVVVTFVHTKDILIS